AANARGYRLTNDRKQTFKSRKHLFVGEPEDHVSTRRKPSIAHRVMVLSRVEVVRASIKLYDDACSVAHEVNHISAHRLLSAKREAIEAMSLEMAPQQHFRARHRAAKMLR